MPSVIESEVLIRVVEPRDLREVYEVESMSFTGSLTYDFSVFLFYYVTAHDLFLVAEALGRVIGYIIGLIEVRRREILGHVISIAIHPLYRGLGIGSKLLKALEERLTSRGALRIFLEVDVLNKPAISFYRKHGYVISGILKNYYGVSDAYIMVKEVGASLKQF
ncbi:MAG: ribosomal protein S18-alanine N-acetyltransferase [Sulfolobales archaeon]|nr:ribosomal protein S18-alanine N-acetyltransferase [Sulfolobales archaeon]MCX8198646.1 ribosomal protein S18-alanine N-acetyltransferase [Sulfolobales archaeon]MDW8169720.1 ribosomal protein S18-alanine N-acetyltransferase [Desulfurococcaceae archaeon]